MTAPPSYACPHCHTRLPPGAEAMECPGCGRTYPITQDVVRFLGELGADVEQTQRVFHFEHARSQRSWHTRFDDELVERFLADCALPGEFFAGKSALDAGCGSGRWTYALSKLAAHVDAIDLTPAGVATTRAALNGAAHVRVAQADVTNAPFEPGSFDFVMSWGVLHHTPDTESSFNAVAPLVRDGGTLYVMVYERDTALREFGTNMLRRLMRRLPDERRYEACRRLVFRRELTAHWLGKLFMVAYADPLQPGFDPETLQFGLFDAYSPRYNYTHTRGEVRGWFERAGFEQITDVAGEIPGAVRIRGVKR